MTYSRNEMVEVRTKSNRSGGVQGGISNGEELYFRVAFKPHRHSFAEAKNSRRTRAKYRINGARKT